MAQVTLIGPLKTAAGAGGPFTIEAHNIRALLADLSVRFPDLAEILELGVAVAIDGQIYQDVLLTPIRADSEVQILPPIAGG
jgi:sulfur-carrier protein